MFAWTPRGTEALTGPSPDEYMRRSAMLSFGILRTHEAGEVWPRLVKDVAEWLDASTVRGFELGPANGLIESTTTGALAPFNQGSALLNGMREKEKGGSS